MAPEPLEVDPARLASAAQRLLAAANAIPEPPTPYVPTGSDPLSQAIAAQAPKIMEPVTEGLPALKNGTTECAENVGKAANIYEETDKRLGDEIKKRTFPDPERDGKVRAAGFGTWKQQPPPVPVDPTNMTEAQARAAWTAVNNDIARR